MRPKSYYMPPLKVIIVGLLAPVLIYTMFMLMLMTPANVCRDEHCVDFQIDGQADGPGHYYVITRGMTFSPKHAYAPKMSFENETPPDGRLRLISYPQFNDCFLMDDSKSMVVSEWHETPCTIEGHLK